MNRRWEREPGASGALDWGQAMSKDVYRWVIVAAGGMLSCVAVGGMFSLPVFLRPISQDTGWSYTGVSSAMTVGFIAMAEHDFVFPWDFQETVMG